jgi:uncharacterized protein YndB with AHSA1/START domain
MGYAFKIDDEIDVDTSPEDVWEAITVGPRIDSWFMGRNEVEPREGGTTRTEYLGLVIESTVTAWEPPKRFAYRNHEALAGACMRFEWLIERREAGGSTVHFTRRGRLTRELLDWDDDAFKRTDPMYLRKLDHYLEYFTGQIATRNIVAAGPQVHDNGRFWSALRSTFGLHGTVHEWDRVRAILNGLTQIDGVVDYATPDFLGVRTSDALFRFIHAPDGTVLVEHHDFASSADPCATVEAWQSWLSAMFA